MRIADWQVTAMILGVTLLVSGLVIVNGLVGPTALGWGFVPALASGAATLPPEISGLPVWLTPLSATLVHDGWIYLAFNLAILGFCGAQVERPLGGGAVAVLYVAGAYAAAAAQWALGPSSPVPLVGASGAISAVIAAYALLYGERRAGVSYLVNALWLGAAWAGLQLLFAVAGAGTSWQVAVGAPVGGFVAGLALARPLLRWRYRRA